MKQSEQLVGVHAMEEELHALKTAAPRADDGLLDRVGALEEQLGKEKKAVERAAEEKGALMEMMNKLTADISEKEEQVQQLKKEAAGLREAAQGAAAASGGEGSDLEKDKKIEALEAKVKKVRALSLSPALPRFLSPSLTLSSSPTLSLSPSLSPFSLSLPRPAPRHMKSAMSCLRRP